MHVEQKKDIICKRSDWLGSQHPDVAPVAPAQGNCRETDLDPSVRPFHELLMIAFALIGRMHEVADLSP